MVMPTTEDVRFIGTLYMYVEGVGLEDFEECERTFSRSNELASVT